MSEDIKRAFGMMQIMQMITVLGKLESLFGGLQAKMNLPTQSNEEFKEEMRRRMQTTLTGMTELTDVLKMTMNKYQELPRPAQQMDEKNDDDDDGDNGEDGYTPFQHIWDKDRCYHLFPETFKLPPSQTFMMKQFWELYWLGDRENKINPLYMMRGRNDSTVNKNRRGELHRVANQLLHGLNNEDKLYLDKACMCSPQDFNTTQVQLERLLVKASEQQLLPSEIESEANRRMRPSQRSFRRVANLLVKSKEYKVVDTDEKVHVSQASVLVGKYLKRKTVDIDDEEGDNMVIDVEVPEKKRSRKMRKVQITVDVHNE